MNIFDIFAGTRSPDAVWLCSLEGSAEAVFIMKKLAATKPGTYFVFDRDAGRVLAEITTVAGPQRAPESDRKNNAA
jgi:glucose dehydrogenase